jgi:hypothetical protein
MNRNNAEDIVKSLEISGGERRKMAEEIVAAQNLTTLEEAKEFATAWIETAAFHAANEEFYRTERDRLLAEKEEREADGRARDE